MKRASRTVTLVLIGAAGALLRGCDNSRRDDGVSWDENTTGTATAQTTGTRTHRSGGFFGFIPFFGRSRGVTNPGVAQPGVVPATGQRSGSSASSPGGFGSTGRSRSVYS